MAYPLCSLIRLETYPECIPLQFTEYWTMSAEVITLADLRHIEKVLRAIYGEEVARNCMYTFSEQIQEAYILGGSDNEAFLQYKPPVKGITEQEFSSLLMQLSTMERRALLYALLTSKPINHATKLNWDFAYRHTTSYAMKNILLNFNAEPFCDLAFWQREPGTLRPVKLTGLTEKVVDITQIDFWKFMKKVKAGGFDLEQFVH
ncbi:hypothetical protein [Endozoicomonas euniceicola]|uniref:Uncharacterized protein n=1 Tax=Endozoicomonas euniceicola TaxID=1234143 RepID=A0ABY6GQ73_9GAMM|nr:hypothetical protein [Endozoicomonas euniceicola]UYM14898.1 hypothetical protein NX720_18685 [Endozoicomonas euniceicola]